MKKVFFRVDASILIGIGHVMRCLTLANLLKNEGLECIFICREHSGNLLKVIQGNGHSVFSLSSEVNTTHSSRFLRQEYSLWLGTTQNHDAKQTIAAIQSDTLNESVWLIVDHYALDKAWEEQLRPYCQKLMVIDDLADRLHDCDLLLDQTYGRDERDYHELVPEHCTVLAGSYYALLRPEFNEWREYSLNRRKQPQLEHLLITLGGVDKGDVTGQVLDALAGSSLPKNCQVTIVMGEHAPCLESVKLKAQKLPWSIEVSVNVVDMAELMAKCDLCIGAAGSTTWERCCLGLPTIMLVLADNQRKVAVEIGGKDAAYIVEFADNLTLKFSAIFNDILSDFPSKVERSSILCDGLGTKIVSSHLLDGSFIRRMNAKDVKLVWQWRNHPSVKSYMFNQNEISQAEHEKWFLENSCKKNQFLLLFECQGKLQGFISFNATTSLESADWGLYKAPDSPRGTGTLMANYVLDYVFKKIGLKKINAQVIEYNQNSLAFHEKLGFHKERTINHRYPDVSNQYEVIHFSMNRKEWLKREYE